MKVELEDQSVKPLPCPFCGWTNIRVFEDKQKKGLLKGSKFMFCWCKACGTRGPWAYNVKNSDAENYEDCVKRWNERNNRVEEEL